MRKDEKESRKPKEPGVKPAKVKPEKQKAPGSSFMMNYSAFDYMLMIGFVVLVGGMFYLKAAEEAFGKDRHRIEMALKGDDYYTTMGLDSGASIEDIRKKYRELVFLWHPDKNPGCNECQEKFSKIARAYENLVDDNKRKSYDSSLKQRKVYKSESTTLTSKNFQELVVDSGEFWVIQLYESTDESYGEAASLWESTYKTWKDHFKLGRIDAADETELISKIPFNIQSYPSIITYSPTGEYDLLPITASYNPTETEEILLACLNKAVKVVPAKDASSFLQLEPRYFPASPLANFNFLLLRKKQQVATPYLKNAMSHQKIMPVGVAEIEEREDYNQLLSLKPAVNLLITYPKYTFKGERITAVEKRSVVFSDINPLFDVATKHTIVELYKNNFMKYCSRKAKEARTGGEAEEATPAAARRLVCVVGLVDDSYDIKEKLTGYQQHVHAMFAKALPRFKQGPSNRQPFDVQYAAVSLNWHPELQQFVYQTQDSFDCDKKKLNYMVITADNGAFSIFSASTPKELHRAVNSFMDEKTIAGKDYFGNYKVQPLDLLSRDDDTFLGSIIKISSSWFMIISLVALSVVAYMVRRRTGKSWLMTFVGLSSTAFLLQSFVYFFINFEHFFGRYDL